jgi:hypothetical protein
MAKAPADQHASTAAAAPQPARAEDIAAARALFVREVRTLVRARQPLTVALFLAAPGCWR